MTSKPSAAVQAAAKKHAQPQDKRDKLIELQALGKLALETEQKIAQKQEEIKNLSEGLRAIYYDKMPSLMIEARVDTVGIPKTGNSPGFDFKLDTLYSASIPASWDEEKKAAGFGVLKKMKAEALIKADVTAMVPKGGLAKAKSLLSAAKKLGLSASIKESVHHGTLSAWLREQYEEKGKVIPKSDLEKIGGFVGKVVKPKERKE